MTPLRLVALLAFAGATGFIWWTYLRREPRVRVRLWLAGLRTASVAVVILLLLDLELPGSVRVSERVVVDGSRSMQAVLDDGSIPAESEASLTAASSTTPDTTIPAASSPSPDADDSADDRSSRLSDRVARAVELGSGRVTLVTDGRISDGVELRALLAGAPVDFTVVDVGGPVTNAGVVLGAAAGNVRAGEEFELPVAVVREVREGGASPVALEILVDDELVARETIAAPLAGDSPLGHGPTRVELRPRIRAPETAGPMRVTARVRMEGDRFAPDDERSAVVDVDRERGAIVLISTAPGWEVRYLASTLAEVAGLPVVGLLQLSGPDGERFLRTGDTPGLVGVEAARRATEDAALVVLDGAAPGDSLLRRALETAPRRIVIGESGDGPPLQGQGREWYVSGELPTSPLAAELAGLRLLGLPPLQRTADLELSGAVDAPLAIALDGTGDPVPAMLLRVTEGGREVRVPTRGWWRWALRPGDPGELYRRLWSGVAGWVLAGDDAAESTGIAPVVPVVAPGREVEWRAPAAAGSDLEVAWFPWADGDESAPVRVDTVRVPPSGNVSTRGLDEGDWRWRATVLDGDAADRVRTGRVVSEAWTDDLLLPRDPGLADLRGAPARAAIGGRPMRGSPLPWLLLLGLLCVEWIVRRRSGLR